ncbi:MAG: fatty acid desaturase family protein [Bacteroidia bacterium]
MRTGRELIMATLPFAKEVKWKSWFHTLSTLFLLIAVNAITFMHIHLAFRILASVFSGFIIVRMFVIYHDNQHESILYRSKAGNVIFTLFGIYVLAPKSIWKRSHDYHHNHNSKLFSASIGSYPIVTKKKFVRMSRARQISYLAIRHPLTIAFGYIIVFIWGLCLQSFLSKAKQHWDSLIALIVHGIFIWATVHYFGWQTELLAITVPFMIACCMGAYLFYAQHNFPGVTFKENKIEWSYNHAALESSSYMVMNPFWRWVTANIGYHHIHHLNSRIPFYRLPEIMASIPELQHPKTTSLNPKDIIACFKLKVWDTEKQEMVYIRAK